MARNLTKPPKKSTIKARITAAIVAVLALVPMLLLCVGAYPAENYIPSTQTVSLGGSAIPAAWSDSYARLTKSDMVQGEPYVMTYGNIELSFADATHDWRYVSFEMHLFTDSLSMGHYSIGFFETAEGLYARLGRTAFTIHGTDLTDASYPVKELVSPDAVTFLVGASLTRLHNSQIVIDLQCYGLDANGRVVDTFVFTEIVPVLFEYMDFSAKTEYARLVNASVIDDTSTEYPHMPIDLVSTATLTEKAYNEGFEEGTEDGLRQGYDAGFSDGEYSAFESGEIVTDGIWDILSMPFAVVASVLNFQILGVNLWTVFSGLLTVVLFFWVLKKVGVI